MSMLYPAMNQLTSYVPNRYMMVNVVARRARQIASEAEASDFAEAAARDVIDGLCEYARCGVRFVDIRYADECLGGDSV